MPATQNLGPRVASDAAKKTKKWGEGKFSGFAESCGPGWSIPGVLIVPWMTIVGSWVVEAPAGRTLEDASMAVRQMSRVLLTGLGLALVLVATGCQSDFNGQTLPSAHWQTDDVQYFPPGPEFKLSREAAAMQALKRDAARGGRGFNAAPLPQGQMPAPLAPAPEPVAPQPLAPPMP